MSRARYLGLAAIVFVGTTTGTYLSTIAPTVANAQVQQGRQRVPPVINQDVLFIPNGGLRMVTEQNRTVGMLFEQGGNGGLVLFDAGGQPSVSLQAGPGGRLEVSLAADPALRFGRQSERTAVTLQVTETQTEARFGESVALSTTQSGGRALLSDARRNATVRIDGSPEGGRVTTYDRAGAPQFSTAVGPEGATLELRDSKGNIALQATPGLFQVFKGEATLLKVPNHP